MINARVVVLRASRLGDFLLAVPALRTLRHALTQAEITYIGLPRVEALVKRCPHIDHFEPFPGFPGIAEQFYHPRPTLAFLQRMQGAEYDLAIQLHGSGLYSNLFMSLMGAETVVGFCRADERVPWLDLAVPYPEQGHEIDRLLALTEALGAVSQGQQLEFPLMQEDESELEGLVIPSEKKKIVVIHPGAEVATKRWPAKRFAELGRKLVEHYDVRIVITGLGSEQPLTRLVAEGLGGKATDDAGRLSLGGLGALLQRAALVVTNDTLIAHIAYALQTPSVTLFGPQDSARWGPLDTSCHLVVEHEVECRPCDTEPCPNGQGCMEGISVDDVFEKVVRLLGSVSG
jgi:ADP-heptose:LPS heptosyltransferase